MCKWEALLLSARAFAHMCVLGWVAKHKCLRRCAHLGAGHQESQNLKDPRDPEIFQSHPEPVCLVPEQLCVWVCMCVHCGRGSRDSNNDQVPIRVQQLSGARPGAYTRDFDQPNSPIR